MREKKTGKAKSPGWGKIRVSPLEKTGQRNCRRIKGGKCEEETSTCVQESGRRSERGKGTARDNTTSIIQKAGKKKEPNAKKKKKKTQKKDELKQKRVLFWDRGTEKTKAWGGEKAPNVRRGLELDLGIVGETSYRKRKPLRAYPAK